ncbi:MAG: hypothetical protein RMI94_06275 [Bryobacterales bacterium]|nr:hypothetical protein [Bryobacteraceae bacterium]MDW8130136.1 hypothetical protein [Bryobacterales bacterium]
MKIKSYFVPSVAAALVLARQELGPEAVLLETRPAPPEAAHLGRYEVIFGTPPSSNGCSRTGGGQEASERAMDSLMREVARLRQELERVRASVARSNLLGSPGAAGCAEEARLLATLFEADLEPELARQVLATAQQRCSPEGLSLEEAVAAELASRCAVDARLGRRAGGPRIVGLVGPSGSGKTTTLVKLAIREGIARRQSVELLSLDNYRVCGAEQLRQFAAILGLPFQAVETGHGLEQALRDSARKDLVLIDTPGFNAAEQEEAAEMAEWLTRHAEIECHLVLTASMRSADLWRVAERFEPFRPARLLFTRLDEAGSFGPLWSLAVRLGKPVSYLCGGQRIPEDIEAATTTRLLELLGLPERTCRVASVAA